tara:strand:+ start:978 stop:1889 length:912 start_codon:yes stop_codon:yes gene_type:complete
MENKIILISGPTASGKSSLAHTLAKKINGEIVNADSIQIYKDLMILTARPDIHKGDPIHHLYGFVNGNELWSVGKWIKKAKQVTDKILSKKSIPILVGGTGLYFKAVTDGLSPIPDIDETIRLALNEELKEKGLAYLHDELKNQDVKAHKLIDKNDQQRILRALEVYRGTGKKISNYWEMERLKIFQNNFIKIKLNVNREHLYNRCDNRCENMFQSGAVEEVKALLQKKYEENAPIYNAIGVNEIKQYLQNIIDIDEAKNLIKFRTHQYAKRQITWLKHQMISWRSFSAQESDKIIDYFIKKL